MCDHSAACNPRRHIRHRILYSILNTATDQRCARSQWNTPYVKKLAPLTTRSSSSKCVSTAEHHTAEQYSKKTLDKTPKASPKKTSIMEHLPGLSQDTKPLRSSSGNREKIFLKSYLGIKCHSHAMGEFPLPLMQNSLIVEPIKGCTEINLYYPSLPRTLQCTLQWMWHTKVHHRYPDLSDKQTWWLEALHCVP